MIRLTLSALVLSLTTTAACTEPDPLEGPPGPQGEVGPAGPEGDDGAPAVALRRRATFQFANVPAQGQPPSVLATLAFTAPLEGEAVVRARGYCNMRDNVAHQLNVSAATTPEEAFDLRGLPAWGVMSIQGNGVGGIAQAGFTTELVVPVMKKQPLVINLYARHESGTTSADCTGTFTVELEP